MMGMTDQEFNEMIHKIGYDGLLEYLSKNRVEKIRTHGNSAVITLPKDWLRRLGWKVGQRIKVTLNGDCIVVNEKLTAGDS